MLPKIKDIDMIEKKINKVNDKDLKSSLNNFLKAYNEKLNRLALKITILFSYFLILKLIVKLSV